MAGVQRKLVHKQFNSPMGLYSQDNVKATLDREIKAFGGQGIEVDEQITKPLNLANSAVLRAVEEEEQMKCDVTCERQSRARSRLYYDQPHTPLHQQQLEQIKTDYLSHHHDITIDRDTVLKINRLATRRNLHKRDHSWPPPEEHGHARQDDAHARTHSQTQSRSSSNENAVHFDAKVCRRHGIDEIREKFNSPTRIIEPTTRELRRQYEQLKRQQQKQQAKQQQQQHQQQLQLQQKNATNKSADVNTRRSEALTNAQHNKRHLSSADGERAAEKSDCTQLAHRKTSHKIDDGHVVASNTTAADGGEAVDDIASATANTPIAKGFSAPETKAADVDIGLVEPRRQYYEQLAESAKKWPTALINNNRRQSHSLERGRNGSRPRRQQLPPLKPRASSGGRATDGHASKAAKLPRRSIKLATEIKICYDTDDEGANTPSAAELRVAAAPHTTKLQLNYAASAANQGASTAPHLGESITRTLAQHTAHDLEQIPLPTPPPTSKATAILGKPRTALADSEGDIKKQQLLQAAHSAKKSRPGGGQHEHIIPVTVEPRNDAANAILEDKTRKLLKERAQRLKELDSPSAQQIYDDACIYLRSIDAQDKTVAYIPAAITIVPSPTKEMAQRWSQPTNLRADIQGEQNPPNPPTPPPPPRTTSTPTHLLTSRQLSENSKQATTDPGSRGREAHLSPDLAEPESEPPTYVTRLPATPNGIQLSRQTSVSKRKSEPTTPQTPSAKDSQASGTTGEAIKRSLPGNKDDSEKRSRRQGIYYTDGEYLFGPFESDALSTQAFDAKALKLQALPLRAPQADIAIKNEIPAAGKEQQQQQQQQQELQAQENKIEIATLAAKYGQIQQSIAAHLRQIDAYIENAKMALSHSLQEQQSLQQQSQQLKPEQLKSDERLDAELLQLLAAARQSPILVIESPLQTVLREIYRKAAASPTTNLKLPAEAANGNAANQSAPTAVINPVENMPVVEQALLDLSHVAASLLDYETKIAQSKPVTTEQGVGVGLIGSSTLRPMLEGLVVKSPTSELLTLERTFVPAANTPQHVTILEDIAEDEAESATNASNGTNNRKTVVEHVADVVASYEELKSSDAKAPPPPPPPPPKLNIAAAKAYAESKFTQTSGPGTPKDRSKSVVSTFVAAQHSQEQLVEQVIDKLVASPKQQPIANRLQSAEPGEEQQQETKISQQPQRNIISASAKSEAAPDSAEQPAQLSSDDDDSHDDDKELDYGEEHGHAGHGELDGFSNSVFCPVCHEAAKSTWGKLSQADRWRMEGAKAADSFDTYQATYEIPSPYVSRQISWEETLDTSAADEKQRSEVQIADEQTKRNGESATKALTLIAKVANDTAASEVAHEEAHEPATTKPPQEEPNSESLRTPPSRASTPAPPSRKYPAPLIEPRVPPRAASPFGLNALDEPLYAPRRSATPIPHIELTDTSDTDDATDNARYAYVPQVEGHNVGLLVRAAAAPPMSLSASPSPVPTASARVPTPPPLPPTASPLAHMPRRFGSNDYADDVDDDELQHFNTSRTSANIAIDTANITASASPTVTATTTTPTPAPVPARNVLRERNRQSAAAAELDEAEKVRSISQPPPFKYLTHSPTSSTTAMMLPTAGSAIELTPDAAARAELHNFARAPSSSAGQKQTYWEADVALHGTLAARESGIINRSFDNVSPRPYITIEGYKRVAWPPTSEERIIREFTPQPQAQPPAGAPYNQQQQPAQQYQQQQHQQHQQQPQPAAAATPAQGPIYNNVQRTPRQVSPYPNKYQQQQQTPQEHYQPQQQQYQPPQQQQQQQPEPVKYTQAQFNRQPSHEPAAQQAPQYEQDHQHVPYQSAQEPMSPGAGWKHIRPPVAKSQRQYQSPGGSDVPYGGYATPQQQQQPQYPAASYNQYQQPSAPHYNQPHQQYQQPPPQNHYQQAPQQQQVPPQQQHYQPPQQQQQQQYQPPQQSQPSWAHNQQQPQYQPTQYQQAPPTNYPSNQPHQHQQQQQYQAQPQANQFNSYSQQPISQDQPDYQQRQPSLPQDYRGASPGIITLRKETPVSQAPAPVYNSQPAAVSYQGGSNMRGDLKWPPPEYKEAAAKENEERRALALGPVCRPRKVHRDYTTFFAKNALNCYYPTYKVPPGTQHMLS